MDCASCPARPHSDFCHGCEWRVGSETNGHQVGGERCRDGENSSGLHIWGMMGQAGVRKGLRSGSGPLPGKGLRRRSRGRGSSTEGRGLTSSPGTRCCCPSSLFPVAVAHLGGRSEPSPCARTAFRLPGLEKVPQEREVYQYVRPAHPPMPSHSSTLPQLLTTPLLTLQPP